MNKIIIIILVTLFAEISVAQHVYEVDLNKIQKDVCGQQKQL